MSQEIIDILKSQIPLFEKMRRSAMLMHAMRGTTTKTALLKYIMEVQTMAWQIIQINEHTINDLELKLNGGKHDTSTTTSESNIAATCPSDAAQGQTDLEDWLRGQDGQCVSGGSIEVDLTTLGKISGG